MITSSVALAATRWAHATSGGCARAVGADALRLGAAGDHGAFYRATGSRSTTLRICPGAASRSDLPFLAPGRAGGLNTGNGDDGRRQGAAKEFESPPPGHRRGEDTGNVIDEIVHVFGPGMRGMRRQRWPDHSTPPDLLAQP